MLVLQFSGQKNTLTREGREEKEMLQVNEKPVDTNAAVDVTQNEVHSFNFNYGCLGMIKEKLEMFCHFTRSTKPACVFLPLAHTHSTPLRC